LPFHNFPQVQLFGCSTLAMTEDKPDNRVAALEAQLAELREENEVLSGQLQQRSRDAADAALAATRHDYRHDKQMSAERGRTVAAEDHAEAAERKFTDFRTAHDFAITNADFNRLVLETTTDCIKILDLDGRLEFMNAGGQRVMEVDNFSKLEGCPWVELWQGDDQARASETVEAAKAGRTARIVVCCSRNCITASKTLWQRYRASHTHALFEHHGRSRLKSDSERAEPLGFVLQLNHVSFSYGPDPSRTSDVGAPTRYMGSIAPT
jgi:PAS domain-containing protein